MIIYKKKYQSNYNKKLIKKDGQDLIISEIFHKKTERRRPNNLLIEWRKRFKNLIGKLKT